MDSTTARLRVCFSRVFPNLTDEQTLKAGVGEIATWDSLATVTLVALIEEEFGVALDVDELDEPLSFQGLLTHIEDHGQVR